MSKICANCKFFCLMSRTCHRHSPPTMFTVIACDRESMELEDARIVKKLRQSLLSEKYIFRWSPVSVDDFCGEFEAVE